MKKNHIIRENCWYYYLGNVQAEIIRIPGRGYRSIVKEGKNVWEKKHRTLNEAKAEVLDHSEIAGPDFYAQ